MKIVQADYQKNQLLQMAGKTMFVDKLSTQPITSKYTLKYLSYKFI